MSAKVQDLSMKKLFSIVVLIVFVVSFSLGYYLGNSTKNTNDLNLNKVDSVAIKQRQLDSVYIQQSKLVNSIKISDSLLKVKQGGVVIKYEKARSNYKFIGVDSNIIVLSDYLSKKDSFR